MEFQYILKYLKLARFISIPKEKKSKYRIFWLWFSNISFVIIHVLMFYHYLKDHSTVYLKVFGFFFSCNGLITFLRKAFIIYKRSEFEDLLQAFSDSPKLECEDMQKLETEMRVRSCRTIKRYTRGLFGSTIGAVVVVVTTFLLYRLVASALQVRAESETTKVPVRLLLFLMWWPSDIKATPTYFFIVAWQCAVVITYLVVSCVSDAFLCAPMLAASERAGFLARAAPQALLPGRDGQVTPQFKAWVNYHLHYLRLIKKTNRLMGPVILITHFSTLLAVTTYLFSTFKTGDPVMRCLVLAGVVVTLFQLLVVSRAGQRVIDKSVQLRHSVVGVAQVSRGALKAGHARNALQVLVTRLSGGARPEAVTGIGFFNVSMQLFSAVWKASMSYLLFLLSFQSTKPIFVY